MLPQDEIAVFYNFMDNIGRAEMVGLTPVVGAQALFFSFMLRILGIKGK